MTDSLLHKEALAPSCHQDGNVEHWYCTGDCAGVWTNADLTELSNHKSVIIPHNVDNDGYVAKVEAGCHQNGMNEYWYCKECDAVFADAALTQLTNRKNLVIAYDSENVVYVAKVEAGCHQNGSEAYWYCTECDAVFTDAALTQLTNRKNLVIAYNAENIVKVDAVAPSCHQNGNVEYWYCSECDAVFTDAALTQLSNRKSVVIACTAEIGHEAAIAVGCHTNGRQEFWYCTECDAVFTDVLRTELSNRKAVVIPYNPDNIGYEAAVAVGCHQNGNIENWYCNQCGATFTDSNLENQVNTATIKYNQDNIVKVEKVEPGCHQNGCEEYWYCTECDAVFADENLKNLTNRKNLTILYTAEIGHEDAIAVQCHINGRQEFWYCMDCGAIFTDMALTQLSNIKSVVIPYSVDNVFHANAADPSCHQNGNIEYWHCLVCDEVYIDATLTTSSTIERVTILFDRSTIAHEDAIAAGCHSTGMMEYWYCTECDAIFTDADLTRLSNRKSIITPCTAEIIHTEKVNPTCTKNGNIEYWECSECAAVFADATLKTPTDDFIISALGHKWKNATCTEYETCTVCKETYGGPLGHTEIEIPGVDATCTESGLTAGKKCTVCNTVTVEQKTIDALGHEYAYETDINKVIIYDVCTRCGERNPENDTPKVQLTDTVTKVAIISVCAIVILIALKALFRPASTTPWYRRRR
jgi:ribosomal protein L37AE/L43A